MIHITTSVLKLEVTHLWTESDDNANTMGIIKTRRQEKALTFYNPELKRGGRETPQLKLQLMPCIRCVIIFVIP